MEGPSLRSIVVHAIFALVLSLLPITSAVGALNAEIDLSNPRIVPLHGALKGSFPPNGPEAAYSGFLYSPRIVFSAAHAEHVFDNQGKKVEVGLPEIYVGRPNAEASDRSGLARVIKRIVAPNYRGGFGLFDDFVIYILDRELVPNLEPARLLTPEIERELIAAKATVRVHGYGEYKDRCAAGATPPCANRAQKTSLPRSAEGRIVTLAEAQSVTGEIAQEMIGHLTFLSGANGMGCSGDSGGSITTSYNGELIYLAPTPNGSGVYACGAGRDVNLQGGIHYASPIYKHLEMIAEAERFIAEEGKSTQQGTSTKESNQSSTESNKDAVKAPITVKKKTITCVKGKRERTFSSKKATCPAGYRLKKS